MDDLFNRWKIAQDAMIAAQKAQLEAATKLMGMGTNSAGALEAAQKVAEANTRAWQGWLQLWGVKS